MRLTLVLKYTRKTKNGIGYRRAFPADVAAVIGKANFINHLGNSPGEAAKNHAKAEAEFQRIVRQVRARSTPKSDLQVHSEGIDYLRRLGFQPQPEYENLPPDAPEALGEMADRDEAAEAIMASYPVDQHTGHPVGMSAVDEFVVRALINGAPPRPVPRLSDAVRLYKAEKIEGSPYEVKKKEQRVDRLVLRMTEVFGRDPVLTSVDRQDARKFRDYLLDAGLKPSSVRRELAVVKALFNHAITENGLTSYLNPFNRLDIAGLNDEVAAELRDPLPPDVLEAVRRRILSGSGDDLKLIWRLLEGTGCRLAEITGLRAADVVASGDTPHLTVEWHENRRIKTAASRRDVPLVADALAAAKEALGRVKAGAMLFDRYAGDNGPTNASSALMRQLRLVTDNQRYTVHSLRHNMADRLMLAATADGLKNLILGHSLGGVGEKQYGGKQARLQLTTAAMQKAFGINE